MKKYYYYEGYLYSLDELQHFKIGFIKPGHKWIRRERSKDGKKWIYTYKDAKYQASSLAEESGKDLARANNYDSKIADTEAELEKYKTYRHLSTDQIKYIKNKQEQLAYYKGQQSKYQQRSKHNMVKAKDIMMKAESGKIRAKAFLHHPFNKAARNKEIQAGKTIVFKILNDPTSDLSKTASNTSKTLSNELAQYSDKRNKQRAEQQSIKDKKIAANAAKSEKLKAYYSEIKTATNNLNLLKNNNNKLSGLKIQSKAMTTAQNQEATNSKGYNDENANYADYHRNCSNASVAFDLRERGYNVEAQARHLTVNGKQDYSSTDNLYEIADMYDGKKTMMGPDSYGYYRTDAIKNGKSSEYKTTNNIIKASKDSNVDYGSKYYTWGGYPINGGSYTDVNNKTYLNNLEKEMLKGGEGSRGLFSVRWSGYSSGHSMAYEVKNGKVVIIDAQTNKTHDMSDFYTNTYAGSFLRTDNLEPNDKIKCKVRNVS